MPGVAAEESIIVLPLADTINLPERHAKQTVGMTTAAHFRQAAVRFLGAWAERGQPRDRCEVGRLPVTIGLLEPAPSLWARNRQEPAAEGSLLVESCSAPGRPWASNLRGALWVDDASPTVPGPPLRCRQPTAAANRQRVDR